MVNKIRAVLAAHPRAEWLIPLACCLILLTQMLFSVRQMSQHADEATHLYAGYRVLKCRDYTYGREHPPLAKMLAALPLLASNPPMDCVRGAAGYDEEDQATNRAVFAGELVAATDGGAGCIESCGGALHGGVDCSAADVRAGGGGGVHRGAGV